MTIRGWIYWILCIGYYAVLLLVACLYDSENRAYLPVFAFLPVLPGGIALSVERIALCRYLQAHYLDKWNTIAGKQYFNSFTIYGFILSKEMDEDPELLTMKRNNKAIFGAYVVIFIVVVITALSLTA